MKKLFLYTITLGIIILLLMFYYPHRLFKIKSNDYSESIAEQRKKKDDFMRLDPVSPFMATGTQFKGLKYFEIDQDYRILARINPYPVREQIRMLMNDGSTESYIKYATADFVLDNISQHVVLFKLPEEVNSNSLFFPFFDETSTISTYGGGRYMDPEYDGGQDITLDFNLAYNPYCAYVEGYACPLPPSENRITVEVNAGEKKYKTQ